ncbi:MAG: phosphoribosylanthranilate isomerase [Pseudomonadota bacterium]
MSIQVKICGFREPEAVRAAVEAGADWIGFNFASNSPRQVEPTDLEKLLPAAEGADVIGLLVDAHDVLLNAILDAGIRNIQLHGSESPERLTEIKTRVPGEVWKAIGVKTSGDLLAADVFEDADRLLIDAKAPEGTEQAGGHGVPFDWSILETWQPAKPWFLAGGLDATTVAEAIRCTGTDAVDVSSGVERQRGVKDAVLIREFIRAAKGTL